MNLDGGDPARGIAHGAENDTARCRVALAVQARAEREVERLQRIRVDVVFEMRGGIVQMIPKKRVKKIRRMRRSLMWPSQLYTFDAQGLADLIAYLKSQ